MHTLKAVALVLGLTWLTPATAHFQELIPSQAILDRNHSRELRLDLSFTHPMAGGPAMAMQAPRRFGVLGPNGREDLLDSLRPRLVDAQPAYTADYRLRRPGDHIFFVEPAPYWEPGEGRMLIHYTKVVVDGFAAARSWDRLLELPVEIEPLSRPYGLWTGNLFRGIVRHQGRPVPFARIEVEWRNDGSLQPPADAYLTQVIKADAAGTFSYAMPRSGWWGFAALIEADYQLRNPAGASVPVELGGLIWVHVRDMH